MIKFLGWLGDNPKTYVEDIKMEYQGVIVEKYFLRTTHLKVLTKEEKILDISGLSFDLINFSHVDDSIIKFRNKNCCNLKNDSINIIIEYINVPKDVLNDKRWPEDVPFECESFLEPNWHKH